MFFPAKVFCAVAIGAVGACALVNPAGAAAPTSVDPIEILALHNKYRAEVGVPPLHWSQRLAQGAAQWAEEIAALAEMKHSGTSGVGENLAEWWGSKPSLSQLIGMWANEKTEFHPGTFPDVSATGNWRSVAHYTQMVWRDTTAVGCGAARNAGKIFLVCWYSPQGNYIGQMPY